MGKGNDDVFPKMIVYDGITIGYRNRNLVDGEVTEYPDGIVVGIMLDENSLWKTREGIGIGSTYEEILEAYPSPTGAGGGVHHIFYKLNGAKLKQAQASSSEQHAMSMRKLNQVICIMFFQLISSHMMI